MPGVCSDCVTHCTVDKDAVIACNEICQLLRSSPPLEQRLLHSVNKDTFRFSPINIRPAQSKVIFKFSGNSIYCPPRRITPMFP